MSYCDKCRDDDAEYDCDFCGRSLCRRCYGISRLEARLERAKGEAARLRRVVLN